MDSSFMIQQEAKLQFPETRARSVIDLLMDSSCSAFPPSVVLYYPEDKILELEATARARRNGACRQLGWETSLPTSYFS